MSNIFIIDDESSVVDSIPKINLEQDLIFSFLEKTKEQLYFDFSGNIHFILGNQTNLSTIKNNFDSNSPFRNWVAKLEMKFCCPSGVVPIFIKPNNSKSLISTNATYDQFIDIKIDPNLITKESLYSHNAIIYQNIKIETTFNKLIFVSENPTMILPQKFILFDLLLCKTFFSNNICSGNIFIIKNDEFYLKFKETI